jgi:UDP-3-O-[3-hydroxymyristoyl] glucosamine N-acyltransferase
MALPTTVLAQLLGAELVGPGDLVVSEVAGIDTAGPNALTFIRSRKYGHKWPASRAGAAVVTRGVDVDGHDPSKRALLIVDNADLAMLKLLEVAHQRIPHHQPSGGVHERAIIDPSAKVAPTARIGPYCVVGPGTTIGEHCVLHANVTIGAGASIGDGSVLHPGVVIYDRCRLGRKCILHAHVSIGADGFGYVPDPSGQSVMKVPHIGDVVIGDDVEIGANSCVDRGKFGSTTIGDHSKIDNLVQIGHNCTIGRCVLVCGVTGIGGSVTIGDGVVVAGHVGIADNISLGAGARIGAKSGVFENVPAGETWTGLPAFPHPQQMRTWAAARKLPDILRALKNNTDVGAAISRHRRDLNR